MSPPAPRVERRSVGHSPLSPEVEKMSWRETPGLSLCDREARKEQGPVQLDFSGSRRSRRCRGRAHPARGRQSGLDVVSAPVGLLPPPRPRRGPLWCHHRFLFLFPAAQALLPRQKSAPLYSVNELCPRRR